MKKNMPIKKAACVLFISPNGKVLTASRRGRPDDIGLPGGKVDEGEEIWEAAIREFYEEVGIMLTKNDITKFVTRSVMNKIDTFETETFLCHASKLDHPIVLKTPFEKEKGIQIKWSSWAELVDKKNSFAAYNQIVFNHYITNT